MMETGDPLAGTERSEASAKNIGMLISKEDYAFIIPFGLPVKKDFTNNPFFRFSTTHYSILPLFQHSKCGAKRS
jgi:hypothetical protein